MHDKCRCHQSTLYRLIGAAISASFLIASSPVLHAGPAIGQFETKDLESNPGDIQFQSQNALSFGQPQRRRKENAGGETEYDDNSVIKERYALELQASVTTWFRTRVGVEFEKERADPVPAPALANSFDDLKLSSVALEGVFVIVPVAKEGFGLGLLMEYEHGIGRDPDQLSVGPILQYKTGAWSALANLLIVQHLSGPDRKRDFAYAAQLQYTVSPAWALAVEAYGTVDRLGNSGSRPADQIGFPDFDQHRIGPVVYYRFGSEHRAAERPASNVKAVGAAKARPDTDDAPGTAGHDNDDDRAEPVSLGVGMLFGLNGNTPDRTLKLSLEVEF